MSEKKYSFKSIMILILVVSMHFVGYSQSAAVNNDRELIKAAMDDYVLALYDVEPERIERSVDTTLHKIGYYDYDGKAYNHIPMTYTQLYNLSKSWNKNGKQANSKSPRKIEIYEIHDKTASAKLTAEWGIDFMHLCKVDGQWKIVNIMWQSPPK